MLTTSGILDDVLSIIQDNSTTMRSKMLQWLNISMQKLAIYRDWLCLQKTADIVASNGAITLPADFAKFVNAKQSSNWFCDANGRITDREAAYFTTDGATVPAGFTQDSTKIYFWPASSASGTITLKYVQTVPTYTDTTSATLWPEQFRAVLQQDTLSAYYAYDMDERAPLSLQLTEACLKEVVRWENRQIAVPFYEAKGFGRKR